MNIDRGFFLTVEQFGAIGKKCSHCDKKADWVASKDSPSYCDEHFPYKDLKKEFFKNE